MAVGFKEWAVPDLDIEWEGRIYWVRPPSVEAMKKVLAAAVRGEINLGIVKPDQVPDGLLESLEEIGPDEHPALGDTWAELAEAGVPAPTIDRMAYYAVFYWARGKAYADSLAALLWAQRDVGAQEATASPKAGSSSPRRTGRRTGSASKGRTGGSTTTGESPRS